MLKNLIELVAEINAITTCSNTLAPLQVTQSQGEVEDDEDELVWCTHMVWGRGRTKPK
jgi:hypothetical protein